MRALLLLSFTLATGCAASLANQTVGHVGCTENEIVTSNEQHSGPMGTTVTWDAVCQGHNYICARRQLAAGGVNGTTSYDISCSEKLAPAAQPAPAPAPTPAS